MAKSKQIAQTISFSLPSANIIGRGKIASGHIKDPLPISDTFENFPITDDHVRGV
jgi:hypothetical protein